MIRNFFKIALRNIWKHKGYSFINIAGLAVGMASCLLIGLWVLDELSFDRFHANARDLYKVEENQHYSGRLFHVTVTPYPIAPALKAEIPEIKDSTRVVNTGTILLRRGEKAHFERQIISVDPSFLDMFSFPIVKGDAKTALATPDSLVVTRKAARKYFGDEDPIGKTLTFNNKYDFRITAVADDTPLNSSIRFDMLIPYEFMKKIGETSEEWDSNSIQTFVQLQPAASLPEVNKKIFGYIRTRAKESSTDLELMPFTRLHLHEYWGYIKTAGAIQYVYIFSIIALFVLVIACVNFMNLATARSANRAKEVGLRKVVGALRGNLIRQFFGESIVFAVLALALALILAWAALPMFSTIAAKQIGFGTAGSGPLVLVLAGITLFTGILAGSYPALFLSSFHPVRVLKGSLASKGGAALFRKALVVFQFTLSISLIIGTLVISKQLHYMRNRPLGLDKDNIVTLFLRGEASKSYETLRNELRKAKGVLGVTGANDLPTSIGSNSGGSDWDGKDPNFSLLISMCIVDYGFAGTMGIKLEAGHDFSTAYPGDLKSGFLVNEELQNVMKKASVVGERFDFMGVKGKIVGVIKNFHFGSLRNKVEPLAMLLNPADVSNVLIRISPSETPATIAAIERTWNKVIPSFPFEYKFLDDDVDQWFRSEERIGSLVRIFAALTIFVACLGLFGLASFAAEQRTREIGIRKVLGASIPRLSGLLCRQFLVLVGAAAVISWPAAYLVMRSWLGGYAYRTTLSVWVFVLAGAAALAIAMLTVGYQAVRAASSDPVKAIKYE
jgi:putative ABC transport system permease protein